MTLINKQFLLYELKTEILFMKIGTLQVYRSIQGLKVMAIKQ